MYAHYGREPGWYTMSGSLVSRTEPGAMAAAPPTTNCVRVFRAFTVESCTSSAVGTWLSSLTAALYQIVVTVPAGLANGDYPIVASINGVASPGNVMLTVHQ